MPGLDTDIHLNMLRDYRRDHRFMHRVRSAVKSVIARKEIYGMAWGDPETVAPLKFVRDRYLLPYINPDDTALEIGPGGGRWTRYLTGFKSLYIVDYYPELLKELRSTFRSPNMKFIANSGADFPGIPDNSIDFLFSFGCFVHLDLPIINAYLGNMPRVLKPNGVAVIQYSDSSKIMARENKGFADNDAPRMRKLILDSGFSVIAEDLTTLWHSNIIIFVQKENHK